MSPRSLCVAPTPPPQALKPVIDGMDGIKISQGLGLQDFDLIRVIGRGSYAKVLLVRLKKSDQVYAMKVVKKELVHDDEVSPAAPAPRAPPSPRRTARSLKCARRWRPARLWWCVAVPPVRGQAFAAPQQGTPQPRPPLSARPRVCPSWLLHTRGLARRVAACVRRPALASRVRGACTWSEPRCLPPPHGRVAFGRVRSTQPPVDRRCGDQCRCERVCLGSV